MHREARVPRRNRVWKDGVATGWGFGVHEALDQFGALFGPLLGSVVIGVLIGVSAGGLVAFCVAAELATIPLLLVVRRTAAGG